MISVISQIFEMLNHHSQLLLGGNSSVQKSAMEIDNLQMFSFRHLPEPVVCGQQTLLPLRWRSSDGPHPPQRERLTPNPRAHRTVQTHPEARECHGHCRGRGLLGPSKVHLL